MIGGAGVISLVDYHKPTSIDGRMRAKEAKNVWERDAGSPVSQASCTPPAFFLSLKFNKRGLKPNKVI